MNFSDPEVLKKVKQRDHQTITALIEKYHMPLYKGALKQKLAIDQAEDVVQQTWGTFFESVENFKGHSHIRTYLFGIMLNKIRELWRSNKKYTQNDQEFEIENHFRKDGNYAEVPKDPKDWVESKEFISILHEELENLSENQRLAFTLKEIDGEKTQDICNILDISSTNLGVLLFRAKNILRTRIEKRLEEDE
jgi:RNA polymerase sigma-70 factor (ECF subfamily)